MRHFAIAHVFIGFDYSAIWYHFLCICYMAKLMPTFHKIAATKKTPLNCTDLFKCGQYHVHPNRVRCKAKKKNTCRTHVACGQSNEFLKQIEEDSREVKLEQVFSPHLLAALSTTAPSTIWVSPIGCGPIAHSLALKRMMRSYH